LGWSRGYDTVECEHEKNGTRVRPTVRNKLIWLGGLMNDQESVQTWLMVVDYLSWSVKLSVRRHWL